MKEKLDLKIYPKTIYTDIVGLPDPVMLGITIHYYNHSDETLYMKIFIEGPSPWSSNAVALGSLAGGANAYVNLDNFTSRTKPTSATTEVLTLTLRGYTDSGYSILKYEFSRSLTVVFIKSDDGSWTQDVLNNFDDGTIQGWSAIAEVGLVDSIGVTTDYVLSTPYSLKIVTGTGQYSRQRIRVYKSFTTPNKDNVYAIFNVRLGAIADAVVTKNLTIKRDDTILIFLGRAWDDLFQSNYVPANKWLRIVVPLPKNTTLEIRIIAEFYVYNYKGTIWQDDFKIISK
jgi:hypothetical protein